MAKKRSFHEMKDNELTTTLPSLAADSASSGASSTSFSRSGLSDSSADLGDSRSLESGGMVAALEVSSPISAGRAPWAAASAAAPFLSSTASPFMPDWLAKVLGGSNFARASDSEAGSGEYFMKPVSNLVQGNIIDRQMSAGGRSPLSELPVQDFVSPPSIAACTSQSFCSPDAAASPSTPTRLSARPGEEADSPVAAPTMSMFEEQENINVVLNQERAPFLAAFQVRESVSISQLSVAAQGSPLLGDSDFGLRESE